MSKIKKRRRKKMNTFRKIMIALGVTLFAGLIIVVGLVIGSLFGYVEDADLIDVDNMRLNLTSFVYATDPKTGETVEVERLYDTENRVWANSSQIPQYLKDAFVAIEDERFYSHCGVDVKRFAGAAMQYITNYVKKENKTSYGGSTITQQLIKNLTQDDEYSVKRKIQEIYRAYNLERQLSKDEILEYYLNTIYLSQKCNGVQSAARTYFDKDVSDLSLAECASIAGITKYPTKYDPIINPENNKERQQIILNKMLELGFITKGEYENAINENLKFCKKAKNAENQYRSYFTDAAIDQIIKDLMKEYKYSKEYASKIVYNGGLKIYLSVDTDMQKTLDTVFNDKSTFQATSKAVQPQSSMVIMDPYTGEVKALIGGRGEKEGNRILNRATQTKRQPGSTIKPLSVYSPCLEYGLATPSSIVNDSPISFGKWTPRNDDRNFKGRITVRAALRGSRNVPAVKLCNYLTPEASFDFVENNYHISTLVDAEKRNGKLFTDKGLAQIALGGLTDGVSVLEMCAAYCVFPNGGKYIEPTMYTKVVDSQGKTLLEHKKNGQIAISETTAKEMISMLTDVVTGGTGTSARISGMRVAGKTGTTSSNYDRWFVGFTPYYVGAVWFGYDQQASLRGFSSNPAAIAWRKVMTPIHKDLKNKEFLAGHDDKLTMMVCADSGDLCTPACKKLVAKEFDKDDVPHTYCKIHKYKFNKNELMNGTVQKETVQKNEHVEGEEQGGSDENQTDTQSPNTNTDTTHNNTQSQHNTTGQGHMTTPKPAPTDNANDSAGTIID